MSEEIPHMSLEPEEVSEIFLDKASNGVGEKHEYLIEA
jgi:hypothetical protein